jgi:hypothetical protein
MIDFNDPKALREWLIDRRGALATNLPLDALCVILDRLEKVEGDLRTWRIGVSQICTEPSKANIGPGDNDYGRAPQLVGHKGEASFSCGPTLVESLQGITPDPDQTARVLLAAHEAEWRNRFKELSNLVCYAVSITGAPEFWKPCDDVPGLLSQLSNILAGLKHDARSPHADADDWGVWIPIREAHPYFHGTYLARIQTDSSAYRATGFYEGACEYDNKGWLASRPDGPEQKGDRIDSRDVIAWRAMKKDVLTLIVQRAADEKMLEAHRATEIRLRDQVKELERDRDDARAAAGIHSSRADMAADRIAQLDKEAKQLRDDLKTCQGALKGADDARAEVQYARDTYKVALDNYKEPAARAQEMFKDLPNAVGRNYLTIALDRIKTLEKERDQFRSDQEHLKGSLLNIGIEVLDAKDTDGRVRVKFMEDSDGRRIIDFEMCRAERKRNAELTAKLARFCQEFRDVIK